MLDSTPSTPDKKTVPIERQYLTLGGAAVIVAFACGLALNVGSKLQNIENLTTQVRELAAAVNTQTVAYQVSEKENLLSLADLKARVTVLEDERAEGRK